jgi:hypothetical protein
VILREHHKREHHKIDPALSIEVWTIENLQRDFAIVRRDQLPESQNGKTSALWCSGQIAVKSNKSAGLSAKSLKAFFAGR